MKGGSHSVLVIGACGGAGSTLLAGGLALSAAAAGRPPQLLELDLDRGDLAGAWGVPCDRTLSDLLPVAHELRVAHVRHARHTHSSGVGLLLAPGHPGAGDDWTAEAVGSLLPTLAGEGDVIIDGGSGLSPASRVAAHHVDAILVVTPPTLSGARRSLRLCEALASAGAQCPRLVVNRGTGGADLGNDAVGVAIGAPVMAVMPYTVREAIELTAGRRPRARRGGLVEVFDAIAEALLTGKA
jgi:MinD-like ATPase involved in chromosome partitioning or flagellar assembly